MIRLFAAGENPMTGTEPWLQYGSFGVLVLIMVWGMWKGIPKILDIHKEALAKVTDSSKEAVEKLAADHKEAMTKIVCTFEADSVACRNERIEMQKLVAVEREKDRAAQEKLATHFETVMLKAGPVI